VEKKEILSKYALMLLCTLSAYTFCVLVQIIHPYLLPQNLTYEFQHIGIRFIGAWFCSKQYCVSDIIHLLVPVAFADIIASPSNTSHLFC